jgi:hypothetical protein
MKEGEGWQSNRRVPELRGTPLGRGFGFALCCPGEDGIGPYGTGEAEWPPLRTLFFFKVWRGLYFCSQVKKGISCIFVGNEHIDIFPSDCA